MTTATVEKTLFDRIGYVARQGGGASITLPADTSPAVSPFDIVTLGVSVSDQPESSLARLQAPIPGLSSQLQALLPSLSSTDPTVQQQALRDTEFVGRESYAATTSFLASLFFYESGLISHALGATALSRIYSDSPKVVAVSTTFRTDQAAGATQSNFEYDILRDHPRVVAPSYQAQDAEAGLRFSVGATDSVLEGALPAAVGLPDGAVVTSSFGTFSAALDSGATLVVIDRGNINLLPSLGLSALAQAQDHERGARRPRGARPEPAGGRAERAAGRVGRGEPRHGGHGLRLRERVPCWVIRVGAVGTPAVPPVPVTRRRGRVRAIRHDDRCPILAVGGPPWHKTKSR